MDFELHVVCVSECFQLLKIRDILFRVLLGLRCYQGDQVKVISGERYIEELVRLHEPAYELKSLLATEFDGRWIDISFQGLWVKVRRDHSRSKTKRLLDPLHFLNFD